MIWKRNIVTILIGFILAAGLSACKSPKPADASGTNYMVLVNKLNRLPDDWEEKLETIHMTNSMGHDVEVEKKGI